MKRILTFTAIFIFTAVSAYAGSVETFGIGAKETAQGKAVAAQADTPFAVYYNPAGLTQIEGPTFSAGATVYDAEVTSENFRVINEDGKQITGATSKNPESGKTSIIPWDKNNETDNDLIINPAMGYAMPIGKNFTFGVAAYAPYGLHLESTHNPYENPISFFAWESYYARTAVTPTVAYKFSDKLSFGFGVSLGESECDAGRTYKANPFKMKIAKEIKDEVTPSEYSDIAQKLDLKRDATAPNGSYTNEIQLETKDDFNYSWNAGVMYKPTDKLSLGLTYRSRTSADFEGDILFNGTNVGSVQMDYDHPEQIQGGVRYAFSDTFSVEFDMTWTKWNINANQTERMNYNKDAVLKAVTDNMDEGDVLTLLDEEKIKELLGGDSLSNSTTVYKRDWENTIQYQIGAEWLVNEKLALRGGVVYDPTPVPDDTFDQGWPDTDRTVFNLGAGYKITDKWEIDGVFQYIRSTPSTGIDGESYNLNKVFSEEVMQEDVGVYLDDNTGILYGFGATVTYRF